MGYATVEQVEDGFRTLDSDEKALANALIEESAIIIDAYNSKAATDVKKVVTCRMVRRAIDSSSTFPMGASQGTMTAGPYSQNWTVGSGSVGELYLSKLEKQLLGVGNKIGSYSPVEGLVVTDD